MQELLVVDFPAFGLEMTCLSSYEFRSKSFAFGLQLRAI
jgi:hypothetical protein